MVLCYILLNYLLNTVLYSYFIYAIRRLFLYLTSRLPPGPWGLPYFGSLISVIRQPPHLWYTKMADKYGDIFSVTLGQNLIVCLGSPRLVKELFNKSDSIGRPHTPLNNILKGHGIVLSEGVLWRRQRAFLHECLRNLGVKLWRNQRFERFILMEVEELVAKLKSTNEPLDPVTTVGRHIHNVICQLMMSFRFEEGSTEFQTFNDIVSRGMMLYGSIHIGEHVPIYMNLPGKKSTLNEIKRNLEDISAFHGQHIKTRLEQRKIDNGYQEPADLLDCYLNQIEKEKNSDEETKIFPNVEPGTQVVQVMNDLFSAGMETSRTTLVWALLLMVREPHVAAKVRQELAKVVAPGQQVTLEHRGKLAYVEAVVYETLRRVFVVPLGTTHVNYTEWRVNEYVIPAGTHLIPLLNKINMDPALFPEPDKFIPERFLRKDSLFIPDFFIPFGAGRRVCLGEQLARMELFLFFANVMNNVEFHLPEGSEVPGLDGILGTTHAPAPFTLCFNAL